MFSEWKQAHVGMEPLNNNQTNMNDTTIHHPYILCHFASYILCLLVVCIGGLWKAIGVGSAGYGVHVDVHGEWVMLWEAAL